jgi:hypothetical protein
MRHGLSSEAHKNNSTSKEILRILRNPKIYYAFASAHNFSFPWTTTNRSTNPNPTPSYFLVIHNPVAKSHVYFPYFVLFQKICVSPKISVPFCDLPGF